MHLYTYAHFSGALFPMYFFPVRFFPVTSTESSQLNGFFFRVGDIKSATVSSQLTKMKTAKRKKIEVVNLLFLPFNSCNTELLEYHHDSIFL